MLRALARTVGAFLVAVMAGLSSVAVASAPAGATSQCPTQTDFTGQDLSGVVWTGCNLESDNFTNANLTNASLNRSDLYRATISGTNFTNANFTGIESGGLAGTPGPLPSGFTVVADHNGSRYFVGPKANETAPHPADFTSVNLTGGNLQGASLQALNFSSAVLTNVNLSNANLADAYLTGVNISGANLSGAVLNGISTGCFGGVTGVPANLPVNWEILPYGFVAGPGANLACANLSNDNLSNLDFLGTSFDCANLSGANLDGANLTNATMDYSTFLGCPTTVSGTQFLNATFTKVHSNELSFTSDPVLPSDQWGICTDEHGSEFFAGPGVNLKNADLRGIDFTTCLLATNLSLASALLQNTDLTSSGLSGVALVSANLSSATLTDANLSGSSANGATLTNADLQNVSATGRDFTNATLTNATITGADFSTAILTNVVSGNLTDGAPAASLPQYFNVTDTWFVGPAVNDTNATFTDSLSGDTLTGINLSHAVLGVDLSGTVLTDANLSYANISNANISGTDFAGATCVYTVAGYMTGTPASQPPGCYLVPSVAQGEWFVGLGGDAVHANLSGDRLTDDKAGWNLEGNEFISATLENVDFTNDNLEALSFQSADLYHATMTGAIFGFTIWTHATCPDGTNADNDGGTCINNLTW